MTGEDILFGIMIIIVSVILWSLIEEVRKEPNTWGNILVYVIIYALICWSLFAVFGI